MDVDVFLVVHKRLNLIELSHGRDPQHQNLDQRERVGRQPIAQHRLETFGQSASVVTKHTSEIPGQNESWTNIHENHVISY